VTYRLMQPCPGQQIPGLYGRQPPQPAGQGLVHAMVAGEDWPEPQYSTWVPALTKSCMLQVPQFEQSHVGTHVGSMVQWCSGMQVQPGSQVT